MTWALLAVISLLIWWIVVIERDNMRRERVLRHAFIVASDFAIDTVVEMRELIDEGEDLRTVEWRLRKAETQ
jgi:hypothetical protein